ncbi:L10-interacting MYB domain-containing protein-like [Lactuca sativa]|uniref:L10-interacting MYB domain-containing protein-like n=1 Tax=Lactuca sativa TaxID=4236 RepID=UPI000CD8F865|nr:L10-interacting MYB domain-containing protein-like [Lactuca sativa]
MIDKHTWTDEQTKFFWHTCIEKVQSVGRKGLCLHKHSWNKLETTIKEKFGVDLSQRQLKNAYDNLKSKYTGWLYLKNKTNNLYNPQTNTFNLTNEEWKDFEKGHLKAASLKTVSLLFLELCEELFDGNSASSNLSYATS